MGQKQAILLGGLNDAQQAQLIIVHPQDKYHSSEAVTAIDDLMSVGENTRTFLAGFIDDFRK